MAQIWRHYPTIAAALSALAALAFAPALAQDQGSKHETDLFERPVLVVDPRMHTAKINSQAVDAGGRFAVTGSDDRTVRIWSAVDGTLLQTIWIPVGPEKIGVIYAVAISPDGSMIAAGGWTERLEGPFPIYLFDRESGNLIRRIDDHLPSQTASLTFSPDGRYLAATVGSGGLRIFDREGDWTVAFRDDQYGGQSDGAAFSRNGRLATTAFDGFIRLYEYDANNGAPNFRRVGVVKAASGFRPRGVAFSPDDKKVAVGYSDVAAVDVLDATSVERLGGQTPATAPIPSFQLGKVAWSADGQTLFAAGGVQDGRGNFLLFAWDREGLGDGKRFTYCAADTAGGVAALPDGRILVSSMAPCVGLMDSGGNRLWNLASPKLDFRGEVNRMRVSPDGQVVDFGYRRSTGGPLLRFDVKSLRLSSPPPNDDLTFAPLREGLAIDHWFGAFGRSMHPTLAGRPLPLEPFEDSESLAIAPDAKSFFIGSSFALVAFDDAGAQKWRRNSRDVVWAVNATKDGRIVVAADGDGAIRWHRSDDGRELLALQVLLNGNDPAKWDWVLWTPEGFYEATAGAEEVLKWVVNHGPDKAATTRPVSAIPKLHRPDALKRVLDELETARAVGLADVGAARLEVQKATGSARPPGAVLHVLAIGVDTYGDKAGGLHLNYAAKDASDVATALLESQKGGTDGPGFYADVKVTYLPNEKASKTAIEDALDATAQAMALNEPDQDVAVILFSGHGEMIDDQFYLVPYDFIGNESKNAATSSAVSASELAKKVATLAAHGKVLLLIDACHSGAVGAGGWASNPDADVLRDTMNMTNVTVLTSSTKNELSEELPEWKHGALAQAFLDALAGAADSQGIVRLSALTDEMEKDVQLLTRGRQHLGMHANFIGDLFLAGHY